MYVRCIYLNMSPSLRSIFANHSETTAVLVLYPMHVTS